jgi:phosphatidylserine decarboxylase
VDHDGWLFVGPSLAAAGVAFLLAATLCGFGWWCIGGGCSALAIAFALFFRDPERVVPSDPRLVLAPADGEVTAVVEEDESFLGEPGHRVSIFLSPLDVHINRSPVAGRIVNRMKRRGRHLAAFKEDATAQNAAVVLDLEGDPYGRMIVRQIVGVLARRIVCRVREGDVLTAGQRIGLMRFSSRMDVVMPTCCRVVVSVGDRVRGGVSPIAEVA